jgi:hypothetical protein
MKHLSELRPGLERPSAWLFWLRFLFGSTTKYARMIAIYVRVARWRRAIERDPAVYAYMDRALTPVAGDDEEDTLDLLTKTTGAVASVAHARKVAGRSPRVLAAE